MSTLLQDLAELQETALVALSQTNTTEASEGWYRDYLGRQGRLTKRSSRTSPVPKNVGAGRAPPLRRRPS